jgi:hypothetical protein
MPNTSGARDHNIGQRNRAGTGRSWPTTPERRPNSALRFRCKGCKKDFAVTSGTFASHKMPLRGYLAAIAVFCNEVPATMALGGADMKEAAN